MKNLNKTNRFLNIEIHGNTVILYINYCLLLENKTYEYRDEIIEYFHKLNNDDAVKVVVISNDHKFYSLGNFRQMWDTLSKSKDCEDSLLRIFRIYNQLFLQIKSLNKVIISMNSKSFNPMLFNFSMSADIKIISNDFHVDNNNINMMNIPKGGCIYSESFNNSYINPVKLMFLKEKVFSTELMECKIIDQVFHSEDLKNKTLAIAKRLENIDYSEIEAVKALFPRKLRKLELVLQSENEFLMSCIRKRRNQNTQEIHRFH